MQFTIRNGLANTAYMRMRILLDARQVIFDHKITPGEQNLNRYLIEHYDADLRVAFIYLLSKCKFYKDLSNTITILFPEKEDDKLAALITYGNGLIKGSNLLKYAFFRLD